MHSQNSRSALKKVGYILIGIILSIVVILSIPEGSKVQLLIPFFMGGAMGFISPQSITKLDIVFHHVTGLVFFLLWFFIVPNPIESILFLTGILYSRHVKNDLKYFNKEYT